MPNWWQKFAGKILRVNTNSPRHPAPVKVIHNPTPQQLRSLAPNNGIVRAVLDGNDLYAWSAFDAVHINVIQGLGLNLNETIPVVLNVLGGSVYGVTVTDTSGGTFWHHNPQIGEKINSHRALQNVLSPQFTSKDLDFYDQSVSGDWRLMSPEESA